MDELPQQQLTQAQGRVAQALSVPQNDAAAVQAARAAGAVEGAGPQS